MLSQIKNVSLFEVKSYNIRVGYWKDLLDGNISSMELDGQTMYMSFNSRANMVVLGQECYIIQEKEDKCSVSAFVNDVGTLSSVKIVDAALSYDCPQHGLTLILAFQNALYIPSMRHHLVPPFILRETGATVNEVPKIHCKEPSPGDHTIWFKKSGIRIPLELDGIFPGFRTRKSTVEEIMEAPLESIEY